MMIKHMFMKFYTIAVTNTNGKETGQQKWYFRSQKIPMAIFIGMYQLYLLLIAESLDRLSAAGQNAQLVDKQN
jgi:hypothetical protein